MSGGVKVHDWQDTIQREAAVTELQAFCTASISRLKLDAFKPVLLKGAVADWPAVDKWSLDWLVQQYGEQRSAIGLLHSEVTNGLSLTGLMPPAIAMSGNVFTKVLLQSAGASSTINALHIC